MPARWSLVWSSEWSHGNRLHGALVVVVACAVAVVWLPVVAALVAATGRLLAVASLGPVGGQVAEATNRLGGMPPRAPLRKRGVPAVWLRPERALGVVADGGLGCGDAVVARAPDRARPP